MPHIRYREVITESVAQLDALERQLRGQPTHPRIQLLRLLKTGRAPCLLDAAPLLGFSVRQVNRWWARYRTGGLAALLTQRPRPGRRSRLTAEAWAGLEAAMTAGAIATLRDAQRYLRETWQIEYPSLSGVWWQLRQRRVRLKTGRRRHRHADPQAQADYKRRLRHDAPAGAL